MGVAAMSCWQVWRLTSACDLVCTFGSAWIGTLHIRQEPCLCPCAATSVSESPSSFDCTT